jgi:UDP-N-acetylmuramoylalanine--D-glutamate ligase
MKIAIAGHGVEGEINYQYWNKPGNEVTIVDQRRPSVDPPEGVSLIIGEDAFHNLNGFDLVVRTAGLAPYKITTSGKIWSGTNEFFAKCPALIIGVTGSKGKGTTSSIIAAILKAAGKKVWLVGNIGLPAIELLGQITADDYVVYELSSFQLWDVEYSPHIAVVLFIEQEHLDVHRTMEEYLDAKAHITRFQKPEDILIYNAENKYSAGIAGESIAQKIPYPDNVHAHIKDESFYYGEQIICSVNELQLLGTHNQDNACAAIDAIWSITKDTGVIKEGLHSFTGLPHRLKFVREVGGVRYYDDSIATTPTSAIAALRAFPEPKVILLGGSPKGSDFDELARELNEHEVHAILVGQEAHRIAASCDGVGFTDYEIVDGSSMAKIVSLAHEIAEPGSVVLLSPAAASFDFFKNYADRGDQFIAAVNEL